MSEHTSRDMVIPGLGEVVDLDDPVKVAFALDGVRDLERNLREIKSELTAVLIHHAQVQGTKTLHLDGVDATVKSGNTTVYDAEAIEQGLRVAGMPEERIREVVKENVTYTVDAVKAKQAAGANPAYFEVIEANKHVEEKPPYVTIKR